MSFRTLLTMLLALCSQSVFGQLYLSNNTNLYVPPNCKISTSAAGDSILVMSGSSIINDGEIDLGNNGLLNENTSPIAGNGFEFAFQTMFSSTSSFDFGGLGFVSSNTNYTDSIAIKRYHNPITINGMISISRSYEVFSLDEISPSISLKYAPSELNGITEAQLSAAHSANLANWYFYNPGINVTDNISTPFVIDSLNGVYTLVDSADWVGINIIETENFQVFPTIASAGGHVQLILPSNDISSIYMYSYSGMLILEQTFNQETGSLKIPQDISKGQYIIVCQSSSHKFIQRIVVN